MAIIINQDRKCIITDVFLCSLCVSKILYNDILEILGEMLVIDRDGRLCCPARVSSVIGTVSSMSGT